jgi:CheY-like chemotaxis protein
MILFVDDEKQYIENVISELEGLGLDVKFCSDVDAALALILDDTQPIEAILLDVMMPHGTNFPAQETDYNRITGLRLLEKVRACGVKAPVILLTNLEPGRAPVDETAKKFPPCEVIRKRDKWSFEIAESIRDVLRERANG